GEGIGQENRAGQRGGKMVGRRGEMEAHVSEQRDEVEQHAEADAVGGEKLRIFEMPQHLPRRSAKTLRANEAFLLGKQQRERDGAGQRHARKRQEGAAPADEIAEEAWNEAAAESADT